MAWPLQLRRASILRGASWLAGCFLAARSTTPVVGSSSLAQRTAQRSGWAAGRCTRAEVSAARLEHGLGARILLPSWTAGRGNSRLSMLLRAAAADERPMSTSSRAEHTPMAFHEHDFHRCTALAGGGGGARKAHVEGTSSSDAVQSAPQSAPGRSGVRACACRVHLCSAPYGPMKLFEDRGTFSGGCARRQRGASATHTPPGRRNCRPPAGPQEGT